MLKRVPGGDGSHCLTRKAPAAGTTAVFFVNTEYGDGERPPHLKEAPSGKKSD